MTRTRQQILDELLVLRCQSGEAGALSELLHRWHDRLLCGARRLLGESADAADALQEALITIARSIRQLDDPALFGPWARRILAHKCADAIRRKQRQRRLHANVSSQVEASSRPSMGGSAAGSVQPDDDLAAVRLAIDLLPIDRRALLVMRYSRDMTTQQIAAALQLPEGTVKSRLHSARNELKTILLKSIPPGSTSRGSNQKGNPDVRL